MSSEYQNLNTEIKEFALEERAQFVKRHIGDLDVDRNKAALKKAIKRLAVDPKTSEKRSAQEFEKHIFDLFSIVFTGHPVWNMTPDEYDAFVDRVKHSGNDEAGLEAKSVLEGTASQRFEKPDLNRENEDTYTALHHANNALRVAESVAIEVGQEEYPNEWAQINYTVGLLYKWTLHDWDGRDDIDWNLPFADKMRLQSEKYRTETIPDFESLRQYITNENDLKAINDIIEKLEFTAEFSEKEFQFFNTYSVDNDDGLEELQAAEQRLKRTLSNRVTHPQALIQTLDTALKNIDSQNIEAQTKIVELRTALNGRGLALSRSHSRINASKIESALTKDIPEQETGRRDIDQGIIPNGVSVPLEDKPTLDERYLAKLNLGCDLIKEKPAPKVSLVDLALSQHSVDKQILTTKLGFDLIDGHAEVRHLIADFTSAFHGVGMLSFALKHNAQDAMNICGLFEEEIGLKYDKQILKNLFKNKHYVSHVADQREHDTFPYTREN